MQMDELFGSLYDGYINQGFSAGIAMQWASWDVQVMKDQEAILDREQGEAEIRAYNLSEVE